MFGRQYTKVSYITKTYHHAAPHENYFTEILALIVIEFNWIIYSTTSTAYQTPHPYYSQKNEVGKKKSRSLWWQMSISPLNSTELKSHLQPCNPKVSLLNVVKRSVSVLLLQYIIGNDFWGIWAAWTGNLLSWNVTSQKKKKSWNDLRAKVTQNLNLAFIQKSPGIKTSIKKLY